MQALLANRPEAMTLIVGGALVGAAAGVVVAPAWFWLPPMLLALAGIGVLVSRHTVPVCVTWLLLAGATLEMVLADLIAPVMYQPTIAAVKGSQLILALVCMVRYGLAADVFNPGLAFLAMFVGGWAHGLHHDLTLTDSVRSLLGSVAPFAFAFSRLSRGWGGAIVRATTLVPLISITGGAVLALAELRPLWFDSGGLRLAGLGHPAFLAGFCLAAIYACLIELYRCGQSRWLVMLVVNFVILLLTGARAPLAYAVGVTGLTLAFLRSDAFPRRCRILPLLMAACLVPLLAVLAHDLSVVRLFNLLNGELTNLSGRELLWPPFREAAAASPWLGWGVGAGNAVIPPDSELARTIQSWAAHNEYLRILVEGGYCGQGLLMVLFVLWVWQHTRRLCRTDRVIMRLVFLAFAAHAYTDNVLIATTACVFFTFATGVFARGDRERGGRSGLRTGTRQVASPPGPPAKA